MSANNEDPRYRTIASVRERMRLSRECESYRRTLAGSIEIPTNKSIREGIPRRRKAFLEQFIDPDFRENKSVIMNNIRKRERTLAQISPHGLSRKERTDLEKQTKEDRAWLRKNMTSTKLFYTKPDSPDFEKAVQSCGREHGKKFLEVSSRYKNHMRQIDPDNPNVSNIESLRK